MRSRLIREKEDAIPKDLTKKLSKYFRNAYNYLHAKCSLPPIFYMLRVIFIFYEYILPCFFPLDISLWQEGRNTTRIMKFLAIFTYFGAIAEGETSKLIAVAILAVIYIAILFLNVIASLIYQSKGRMSRGLMYSVLFCNELVFPILVSYAFAEISLLITSIVFLQAAYLYIFGIIVLIFLLGLTFTVFHFFYYPVVIYNPGSTIFWIRSDEIIVLLGAGIVNFFARFAENANGTLEIIMRAFFVVVMICLIIYYCFVLLFVDFTYNVLMKSIILGGIIISFVQTLKFADQDIIFIFSVIILVVATIANFIFNSYETKKILSKLDMLFESPDDFDVIIRSRSSLILLIRVGIKYGHPYVLTLHPFRECVRKYPNSKYLWQQYLRFVVIYPEENLALMTALEELKTRFRHDPSLKTLRLLATTLLQSRNKHMSSPLKRKLKEFDEYSRQIRAIMISYWTAISEGSSTAAFDLSKQVIHQREELKSQYLHQLSLFPNNWLLCSHFAKNLDALENNQTESEYWASRAQVMRKTDQICDRCHIRGLQTFPNLPEELHNNDDVRGPHFFGGSVASRSSVSSARSQNSMNEINDDDTIDEDKKTVSENIRLMGLKSHVPFLTQITTYIIIFFIIFGFIFPFLPGIPMMISIFSIENYWEIIDDSTVIAYDGARLQFLLSMDVGRSLNLPIFPSYAQEKAALETDEIFLDAKDIIPSLSLQFSSNIDEIIKDIGLYFDQTKTAAQEFFTASVVISYPDAAISSVASISESLSYASAQLFGFNGSSTAPYKDEEWFRFIMANIINITSFFFDFSSNLYYDSIIGIEKARTVSGIITIIVDVVLFIVSLVFFILLYSMKKKWDGMILAFSKLPKSAIHQTVAHFSASNANVKVSDEERLYNSEFMTMATSRDSQGGLPIVTLAILFVFLDVVMIFATTILFISSANSTFRLQNISMRYTKMRETEYNIFRMASLFNFFFSALANSPILAGTKDEFFKQIIEVEIPLSTSVSEWIIGGKDGSNFGLMSSSAPELINKIFEYETLVGAQLTLHDIILRLPDIVYLNNVHQLFEENIRNLFHNDFFEPNFAVLINHLLEQHWDKNVDKIYSPIYLSVMHTDIPAAIGQIIGLPAIAIAIELIILVFIINLINKVKKTVRFCLSTLSFIDSAVVTQSQEISNLLSGSFVTDNKKASTRNVINSVPQFSSEVIILIGRDKRIAYINQVAESNWNIKQDDCVDVDVDLVIRFNEDTIQSKLSQLLQGSIECVDTTETTAVIVSSETTVPIRVSIFPVKEGNSIKQAILVVVDTSKKHEQQNLLEAEREKARNLQLGMYPKAIRDNIDIDQGELIYVSKKITLIVVQLSNIQKILTLENATTKLANFRTKVMSVVNNDQSASHVKTLGSFEFIIFNIIGNDESTVAEKQAIEFCKNVSKALSEDDLAAQFGLTSDFKCPMGMLDPNHMSFDVFGRCMHTGRVLAAAASQNTINIDRLEVNSIQSIVNAQLEQKQIVSKGTKFVAFEYKLEDFIQPNCSKTEEPAAEAKVDPSA